MICTIIATGLSIPLPWLSLTSFPFPSTVCKPVAFSSRNWQMYYSVCWSFPHHSQPKFSLFSLPLALSILSAIKAPMTWCDTVLWRPIFLGFYYFHSLRIKAWASCMLSTCCSTELHAHSVGSEFVFSAGSPALGQQETD